MALQLAVHRPVFFTRPKLLLAVVVALSCCAQTCLGEPSTGGGGYYDNYPQYRILNPASTTYSYTSHPSASYTTHTPTSYTTYNSNPYRYYTTSPSAQYYSAPNTKYYSSAAAANAQYYSAANAQYYSNPSTQYYSNPSTQYYSNPSTQYYSKPSAQYYSNPNNKYYSSGNAQQYYPSSYSSNPVRYTSTPVRSQGDDDTVYITDKYGRTTVSTAAAVARGGYSMRYMDTVTSQYRTGMVAPGGVTTCTAATCGHNAQCSIIGGRPVCSCFRGYTGDPLATCTRAECLDSAECRGHQTCVNERCVDPCAGACGAQANCEARNHVPVCSCPAGYTGDPFTGCRRFDPEELCHPSPCGPNTRCEVNGGVPTCLCLAGYHGSPIAGCRHECDSNAECGSHQACIEFKCQNPCLTQCGTNAECDGVRNNQAICKCPRGYLGSPYSGCQPECTSHGDCPRNKPACFYNMCKDPCAGVCGVGANCELRDVTPICSCPKDMTGDPFVRCRPFEKRDLCEPNPCGANARCEPGYDKYNEERPVCTCHAGHIGDPIRGCQRGECTEDSHCPDHQGCVDYSCSNPCHGQCGTNANCNARRHLAVCTCPSGYNGDALISCYAVSGTAVNRRYYRQTVLIPLLGGEREVALLMPEEEKANIEEVQGGKSDEKEQLVEVRQEIESNEDKLVKQEAEKPNEDKLVTREAEEIKKSDEDKSTKKALEVDGKKTAQEKI